MQSIFVKPLIDVGNKGWEEWRPCSTTGSFHLVELAYHESMPILFVSTIGLRLDVTVACWEDMEVQECPKQNFCSNGHSEKGTDVP